MYNAVEAFNKTMYNLLKNVASKLKRDWHEKIDMTYQATYQKPTQSLPYDLVYGVKVVFPLKCQIPSL